ncbi:hypothetical protein HMPREF1705_04693 [Acetomicrobium hydrogeniformans ATCC BAA-1850]|uniref:Uncharacterized protein n=1 Tax=Acetomicrobium hydrogeniformans ATCC BAA-1850 TaxID=592015 RepID=A0A0T5XCJ8_9BACT|nr:hypothetical protein HMPREF1705_04693 [Acetomicrobium hydrogeniformans ATCC BAA-1850]
MSQVVRPLNILLPDSFRSRFKTSSSIETMLPFVFSSFEAF